MVKPLSTTPILTEAEAAQYIRISTRSMRSLANTGKVRFIATGKGTQRVKRVYHVDDLEEYLKTQRGFQCHSIKEQPASGTMISDTTVIDIMDRLANGTNAQHKP